MSFRLSPPPNDKDVQAVTWKQWFYKIIDALAQPTDLADVTGVLVPEHGGTGSSTIPTNGQVPIGNGTVYVPNTITAGTHVYITNGSGTIEVGISGNGLAFSARHG